MKTLKYLPILFASLLLTQAHANDEFLHFLPGSEGIASPSSTNTLMYQNPAGLIYTQDMQLHLLGASHDVDHPTADVSMQTFGGFFNFGNGNIAGSVGADIQRQTIDDESENSDPDLYIGLAFKMDSINSAFGLGGRIFQVDGDSGETESTNDLDLGYLYGVEGPIKIGFTWFGVLDNLNDDSSMTTRDLGLGLAYQPSDEAVISLDARYIMYTHENNDEFDMNFLYITPGVKVSFDVVQLSLAYRLFQGDEDEAELANRSTGAQVLAGVGVAFTSDILMQLQYNRIGEYELGLTWRF